MELNLFSDSTKGLKNKEFSVNPGKQCPLKLSKVQFFCHTRYTI